MQFSDMKFPFDEEVQWKVSQIVDLFAPERQGCIGDDVEMWRDYPSIEQYDEIVEALAIALVIFGGCDVDDLVERVKRYKWKSAKEAWFPYVYMFPRQ